MSFPSCSRFALPPLVPAGKEWNSVKVFDDAMTARVTTKAGAIIAPMQLTKGVKAAGAKRKVALAEKVVRPRFALRRSPPPPLHTRRSIMWRICCLCHCAAQACVAHRNGAR